MKHQDTAQPSAQQLAERLGLQVNPFAADALPEFFFVGGRRRFLAQKAVHALYFAGGIVLLSGERGAGKTRVLEEISRELSGLADICRIDATVMMDAAEIRRTLAAALGLGTAQAQDSGQLIAALSQLRPGAAEPLPVVIAIDDAEQLAVPVLTECEALVQGAGGRLRLLLVGEPELLTAWGQLGDVACERIELPPLQPQEVTDYVRTSLQAAGHRQELPLSELQLQELVRHSRGNFATIRELAPVLLAGTPAPAAKLSIKGLPVLHIGAAALLLVVVVALFSYRNGNDADETAASAQPVTADARRSVPLTLPPARVERAPEVDNAAATSVPLNVPEPVATVAPAAPAPVLPAPPRPAPAPVASAPAPKPTAPVAAKPAAAPAAKATANTSPAPAAKPAAAPVAKPVAPAPAKAVAANADERQLLALPAQQFMLQLMAGYSRDTLKRFAGSAGGVKIYAFETRLKGRPWYVAVTGPYPDKDAAVAAIPKLPAALRNAKPWPRSVASIQTDINTRGSR